MKSDGGARTGALIGTSGDALERVRARLEVTPISKLPAVAEKSGVSFGALFKIKYGTTKNPRFDTVKALSAYFEKAACPN